MSSPVTTCLKKGLTQPSYGCRAETIPFTGTSGPCLHVRCHFGQGRGSGRIHVKVNYDRRETKMLFNLEVIEPFSADQRRALIRPRMPKWNGQATWVRLEWLTELEKAIQSEFMFMHLFKWSLVCFFFKRVMKDDDHDANGLRILNGTLAWRLLKGCFDCVEVVTSPSCNHTPEAVTLTFTPKILSLYHFHEYHVINFWWLLVK